MRCSTLLFPLLHMSDIALLKHPNPEVGTRIQIAGNVISLHLRHAESVRATLDHNSSFLAREDTSLLYVFLPPLQDTMVRVMDAEHGQPFVGAFSIVSAWIAGYRMHRRIVDMHTDVDALSSIALDMSSGWLILHESPSARVVQLDDTVCSPHPSLSPRLRPLLGSGWTVCDPRSICAQSGASRFVCKPSIESMAGHDERAMTYVSVSRISGTLQQLPLLAHTYESDSHTHNRRVHRMSAINLPYDNTMVIPHFSSEYASSAGGVRLSFPCSSGVPIDRLFVKSATCIFENGDAIHDMQTGRYAIWSDATSLGWGGTLGRIEANASYWVGMRAFRLTNTPVCMVRCSDRNAAEVCREPTSADNESIASNIAFVNPDEWTVVSGPSRKPNDASCSNYRFAVKASDMLRWNATARRPVLVQLLGIHSTYVPAESVWLYSCRVYTVKVRY